MKRKRFIFPIIGIITTIIVISIVALNPPENEEIKSPNDKPVYRVKEYGSKVGIFMDDSIKPEKVLDVFLITLPENDRNQLHEGIKTTNKDQLQFLIQDLSE